MCVGLYGDVIFLFLWELCCETEIVTPMILYLCIPSLLLLLTSFVYLFFVVMQFLSHGSYVVGMTPLHVFSVCHFVLPITCMSYCLFFCLSSYCTSLLVTFVLLLFYYFEFS